MMPIPQIFCYLYHAIKIKNYPAPQDDNSALRQERRDFLPFFKVFGLNHLK
jgi:hypothetical protein